MRSGSVLASWGDTRPHEVVESPGGRCLHLWTNRMEPAVLLGLYFITLDI
jgi:hypothetical protein